MLFSALLPILNLFYTACFEHCLKNWNGSERRGKEKLLSVYFFLDEFGNLGKIDNFASVITTLRKRDCSVSIILQEKAQLDALYGKMDAQTIFAGAAGTSCSSRDSTPRPAAPWR